MNLKLVTGFTTAAATALVVSTVSAPAQAATLFGNSGIKFDTDTTVNFKFIDTHGAYQSTLGVYEVAGNVATKVATLFSEVKPSDNGGSNDWVGTLGTTVLGSGSVDFLFQAGKTYTLGLFSLYNKKTVGTVYSTDSLNSGSYSVQAKFTGNLSTGDTIGFEDSGVGGHIDFNDFNVSATAATAAVPEPTTMVGLALAGLGFAAKRRRAVAQ